MSERDTRDATNDDASIQHAIGAALEDVWSGPHHHDVDVEDEWDEKEENEDEIENVDNEEGEDIEDESYDWDSWDDNEKGLSHLDILAEDFERRSVAIGACTRSRRTQSRLTWRRSWKIDRTRYVDFASLCLQGRCAFD